jgi:hypothetical protein
MLMLQGDIMCDLTLHVNPNSNSNPNLNSNLNTNLNYFMLMRQGAFKYNQPIA